MSTTNRYWLCWSPRQNNLHIEADEDGVRINRRGFIENKKMDYIPIGLFPSTETANAEAERLMPLLRERDGTHRREARPA